MGIISIMSSRTRSDPSPPAEGDVCVGGAKWRRPFNAFRDVPREVVRPRNRPPFSLTTSPLVIASSTRLCWFCFWGIRFRRVLLGFTWCCRVLLGFTGFSQVYCFFRKSNRSNATEPAFYQEKTRVSDNTTS